jgi:hypothetical protein
LVRFEGDAAAAPGYFWVFLLLIFLLVNGVEPCYCPCSEAHALAARFKVYKIINSKSGRGGKEDEEDE